MSANSAISNYRQTSSSAASYATPHRLVQMLMIGALDGIAKSKGHIANNQHEERHKDILWTITVIEALRGALDFEQGGEIAVNLDTLYDYIIRRLYDADIRNEIEPLNEVSGLLKEIKNAWEAMPDAIKRAEKIGNAASAI